MVGSYKAIALGVRPVVGRLSSAPVVGVSAIVESHLSNNCGSLHCGYHEL